MTAEELEKRLVSNGEYWAEKVNEILFEMVRRNGDIIIAYIREHPTEVGEIDTFIRKSKSQFYAKHLATEPLFWTIYDAMDERIRKSLDLPPRSE